MGQDSKRLESTKSPEKTKSTRWFKVTFSSPSWRSLNPLKGSLNHPKKVTKNRQARKHFQKSFQVSLPHLNGLSSFYRGPLRTKRTFHKPEFSAIRKGKDGIPTIDLQVILLLLVSDSGVITAVFWKVEPPWHPFVFARALLIHGMNLKELRFFA